MSSEQDKRAIMLAQAKYARSRDNRDLTEIYRAAARIAGRIIDRQCKRRRFVLDPVQKREKAHDAAAYVVVQYMTREGFSLKKPAGYIYTCVLRELYHSKSLRQACRGARLDEIADTRRKGDYGKLDRNAIRKAREEMEDD